MLSTLSQDLWDTWRRDLQVACPWVADLQGVVDVVFQGFPEFGWYARGRLYFGSFRWRQDLPVVVQTPSTSQWIFQSRKSSHCSTSKASPSVLMLQFFIHLVHHSLKICRGARCCFLFSAIFIACFSVVRTTPTKSRTKYDQVLQLGPFFFPNRFGIKLFGSTNRTRDFVSI